MKADQWESLKGGMSNHLRDRDGLSEEAPPVYFYCTVLLALFLNAQSKLLSNTQLSNLRQLVQFPPALFSGDKEGTSLAQHRRLRRPWQRIPWSGSHILLNPCLHLANSVWTWRTNSFGP